MTLMMQGVESLLRWIELSRATKIFQSKQACAFSLDLDPKAIVDLNIPLDRAISKSYKMHIFN